MQPYQWKIVRISKERNDNFQELDYTLKEGKTTLGRAENVIVRCNSLLSSRRHCSLILKEDGSLFVIDHESLNGTFLHSHKILPKREIQLDDGDIIGVGVDPADESYDPEYPPDKKYVFKVTRNELQEVSSQKHSPKKSTNVTSSESQQISAKSDQQLINQTAEPACETVDRVEIHNHSPIHGGENEKDNDKGKKFLKEKFTQQSDDNSDHQMVEKINSCDGSLDGSKSQILVNETYPGNDTTNRSTGQNNDSAEKVLNPDSVAPAQSLEINETVIKTEIPHVYPSSEDSTRNNSGNKNGVSTAELRGPSNDVITIDSDESSRSSNNDVSSNVKGNNISFNDEQVVENIGTSEVSINGSTNQAIPEHDTIKKNIDQVTNPNSVAPVHSPATNETSVKDVVSSSDNATTRDNKENSLNKEEAGSNATPIISDNNNEDPNTELSRTCIITIDSDDSSRNSDNGFSKNLKLEKNVSVNTESTITNQGPVNENKSEKEKFTQQLEDDIKEDEEKDLSDDSINKDENDKAGKPVKGEKQNRSQSKVNLSESYTVDDDIILLDDGDDDGGEFPCSQMFDVKLEPDNLEEPCVENVDLDEVCILEEEYAMSDDIDSYEWFHKLTQTNDFDRESEIEDEESSLLVDYDYMDQLSEPTSCEDRESLVQTSNTTIDKKITDDVITTKPSKYLTKDDQTISRNVEDFKLNEPLKRTVSNRISEDSDESSSSSNNSKKIKTSDLFSDQSSETKTVQPSSCLEETQKVTFYKDLKRKKRLRKLSSDTDSSSSSESSKHIRKQHFQKRIRISSNTLECDKSSYSHKRKWMTITEEALELVKDMIVNKKKLRSAITKKNKEILTEPSKSLIDDQCVNSNALLLHYDVANKCTSDDIEVQIGPGTKLLKFDESFKNKSSDFSKEVTALSKANSGVETEMNDKTSMLTSKLQEKMFTKDSKTKLDDITKKINESHKKKKVPIIEAKSIRVSNKKNAPVECSTSVIQPKAKECSSEKWLSSEITDKKVTDSSTAEMKAKRKKKLHAIALKKTSGKICDEKPKKSIAKNKTKSTSKSRNDLFVKDLVSMDSTRVADNDKSKKDMISHKIPCHPIHLETSVQFPATDSTSVISETNLQKQPFKIPRRSSAIEDVSLKPDSEEQSVQKLETSKFGNQQFPSEYKTREILQNNSNKSIEINTLQYIPKVINLENITQLKRTDLKNDESNDAFSKTNPVEPKSILIKSSKGSEKRVSFNHPDAERDKINVTIKTYEVDHCKKLKPTTVSTRKIDYTPVDKYESIFMICKWNTRWFQEKNTVKGEPGVFPGQVYNLTREFKDFSEYRRGMFPLLFYELWQVVSRQYDIILPQTTQSKKTTFHYIELKKIIPLEIKQLFFPLQRVDQSRVLYRLECQVLLERNRQSSWPRQGDLVVLALNIIDADKLDEKGQKDSRGGRVSSFLGFFDCATPSRPISTHSNVSPMLRQNAPRADHVMDMTIFIRKPQYLGKEFYAPQLARLSVLKNIKPDLRLFDAVDHLRFSPLSQNIYQPRLNRLPDTKDDQNLHSRLDGLNASQKKAVLTITRDMTENSTMIHLVHGPPGCGKSQVIIAIIQQLWLNWHTQHKNSDTFPQILLCAPSNAAIDDLVIKLMEVRTKLGEERIAGKPIPKFNMVRVGRVEQTHNKVMPITLDQLKNVELRKRNTEEFKKIEIVRMTTYKNKLNRELNLLNEQAHKSSGDVKTIIEHIGKIQKKLAEVKTTIKDLEDDLPPTGKRLYQRAKECELNVLKFANIIATTLSSCYNTSMEEAYRQRELRFGCCIVDEATQCTEPETLIPLMLGIEKLVLVGDPMQLPATVLSAVAKEHGLDKSLFTRHYEWWDWKQRKTSETTPCHFLNIQYRMHPDIALWPSEHFYKRKLLSSDRLEKESAKCSLLPYVVLSHESLQKAQEECNLEEVRLVVSLVRIITNLRCSEKYNIGIITPYNRHKQEIKRRISSLEFPQVEIGTVDSFQGRERDIIIFSCVRTEGVGFMGGTERLNVALTRAKHSLIIIGNFTSLQRDKTWNSLLNNAKQRHVFKPIVNEQSVASLIIKPDFRHCNEV